MIHISFHADAASECAEGRTSERHTHNHTHFLSLSLSSPPPLPHQHQPTQPLPTWCGLVLVIKACSRLSGRICALAPLATWYTRTPPAKSLRRDAGGQNGQIMWRMSCGLKVVDLFCLISVPWLYKHNHLTKRHWRSVPVWVVNYERQRVCRSAEREAASIQRLQSASSVREKTVRTDRGKVTLGTGGAASSACGTRADVPGKAIVIHAILRLLTCVTIPTLTLTHTTTTVHDSSSLCHSKIYHNFSHIENRFWLQVFCKFINTSTPTHAQHTHTYLFSEGKRLPGQQKKEWKKCHHSRKRSPGIKLKEEW